MATIQAQVNDAICEAIDDCRAFEWLPNKGYYYGVSMWA